MFTGQTTICFKLSFYYCSLRQTRYSPKFKLVLTAALWFHSSWRAADFQILKCRRQHVRYAKWYCIDEDDIRLCEMYFIFICVTQPNSYVFCRAAKPKAGTMGSSWSRSNDQLEGIHELLELCFDGHWAGGILKTTRSLLRTRCCWDGKNERRS